jgi:hypothetical protein
MAWYKPVNLLTADPFTLATGIDASETSLTFSTGSTGYLGTSGFGNGIFIVIDFEIMLVTAYVSGETYTVTRAQGGTSGATHTALTAVNIVDVAELYNEITAAIDVIDTTITGKVSGPASATDNAIVRYDGATGKLVQDSDVLIDDSNNVTGVVGITTTGNGIIGGTLAVNGAALTSDDTTFGLLDSTVTTVNAFGAATVVDIGAATGTTTVKNNLTTDGVITAGSGSNVLTNAAGLIDGAKIQDGTVDDDTLDAADDYNFNAAYIGGGAGGTGIDLNADGSIQCDGAITQDVATGSLTNTMKTGGDTAMLFVFDANRALDSNGIGLVQAKWDGTIVADIIFAAGSDTVNKDDGEISFRTGTGGVMTQVLRLTQEGNILAPTLPSASAGLPSGALWYDGADSNRVKYVP